MSNDDNTSIEESTDWTDLTGFQRDLLVAINRIETRDDDSEPYGLGLRAELEELGYDRVNHGRIYPNLDTLVEAELVEKTELDDRTNSYTLTGEGVSMLQRRARQLAELCDLPVAIAMDGGREIEEWHHCVCGARYRSRSAALRCCGDRFGGEQA
ncbi:PadR family transcriptional regulator [Halomicroarcula limicola]|uniref:PadR family transcriptional regulator n=1 Tax=Haloarcula limicola TaxID=1429915 RepID=A0A8J8C905_9EURY|nr:PadR family transcriptional regulator [Halomicroarcula limicola]